MNLPNNILKPTWSVPNVGAMTLGKDASLPEDLPEPPRIVTQVHQDRIICWDKESFSKDIQADASFSTKPGVVCGVQTADCLPLLLTDAQGSFVAAIHAGWRGLAQNIISKSIQTIDKNPSTIMAWWGPAIGPFAFEVQKDVFDAFDQKEAFEKKDDTHWYCDMYHLAKIELLSSGILAENIFGASLCTFSDPQRFESYRRDQSQAGRMISLIWKKA